MLHFKESFGTILKLGAGLLATELVDTFPDKMADNLPDLNTLSEIFKNVAQICLSVAALFSIIKKIKDKKNGKDTSGNI